MSLAERFDRIRVINLAHRADRRVEMGVQLARLGLALGSGNVERFDAIRPTDAAGFPSLGARGCFMSHLGVLREARGARSVLILEDDLDFAPDIERLLPPALAALPSGWGMFYGSCRADLHAGTAPLVRAAAITPIGTAHFVAFNGPVIERTVGYLEAILQRPAGAAEGGPMHVDGAYTRLRADNPDIETWVAIPQLGYQRPSRTDIHALRWFDRMPGVRGLVSALRRQRSRRHRGP